MTHLHTKMAVACGVSTSMLHAARVLVDKAMGMEAGKDYSAILTLIDAAQGEVDNLAGYADDMLDTERQFAPRRGEPHSPQAQAAATGETYHPHQNGEDA